MPMIPRRPGGNTDQGSRSSGKIANDTFFKWASPTTTSLATAVRKPIEFVIVPIFPDVPRMLRPSRCASDSLMHDTHAPVSKKYVAEEPFTDNGMKILPFSCFRVEGRVFPMI